MSTLGVVPRLEVAEFDIPERDDVDGPLTRWEANDGIVLLGYRVDGIGWIAIPGIAAFRFDEAGNVAASPNGGSQQEIHDAWVRSVLPLVVQARGTQVLHASAVLRKGGVLALCGTSTAGKSTLAAALMQRGHRVIADDALGFVVADGSAYALTMPFRLRLRPASAAHLGSDPLASHGDGGEQHPLAEIVLLEPHAADANSPRSELVPPSEAVGALMPHAYCFALEERKGELVRAYASLTASVPVRRLSFPQTLERLEETVDHFERRLGG
jgi:energy-coupling factor transporter ATP-binding protein EcfA2